MHGDFVEQYTDTMKSEIASLIQQKTYTPIPRAEASRVIKITWVFKLKHFPDGTPRRDTYAPVLQWSTLRLLLTLILQEGWATKQVDYTYSFAQA
jgi:hypothetical protein